MAIKIKRAAEITKKLEKIRKEIGSELKQFFPQNSARPFDVDLQGEDAKSLFGDSSGFLVYNNQPTFAYIRDHTVGDFPDNPHKRRKVHFIYCEILEQMDEKRRFESRYRATNRVDNQYLVDISAGRNKSEEKLVLLYPCQYCLGQSGYRCFSYDDMSFGERRKIVESFDAEEAMDLIQQHFGSWRILFSQKAASLKRDTMPAGYVYGVSHAYRKSKKFICEHCGVDLHREHWLIDTHHKDSDKRNNSDDNLQCLCKICHAEQHAHYNVKHSDRVKIKEARERQYLPEW